MAQHVRYTADFDGFLTPEQAGPIFQEAKQRSVIQQVARQVALGPTGTDVPVFSGRPTAAWVDEGAEKPVSDSDFSVLNIRPKKLAVIYPVSAETVRANPAGFMTEIRSQIAEAFAVAFDKAVIQGGTFATSLADSEKETALTTAPYTGFNNGLKLLVQDGKKLTGFVLDTTLEPDLNLALDGNNRPLFLENPTQTNDVTRVGRLLGRPALMSDGVAYTYQTGATGSEVDHNVAAIAGNFDKLVWGVVGGISYDVSDQATIVSGGTTLNLWQRNMLAIRAEAEYGALVADPESFVRYTVA